MSNKMFSAIIGVIILAIVGVALFAGGESNNTQNQVSSETTEVSQISQEVADGEAILLDVRTPQEFNQQHAFAAQNFNVELMQSGSFPDIDKDQKLYVYCRSGSRSAQATRLLEQEGFTNVTDIGALSDWIADGGAVQ